MVEVLTTHPHDHRPRIGTTYTYILPRVRITTLRRTHNCGDWAIHSRVILVSLSRKRSLIYHNRSRLTFRLTPGLWAGYVYGL
jgi:hypothetical protein